MNMDVSRSDVRFLRVPVKIPAASFVGGAETLEALNLEATSSVCETYEGLAVLRACKRCSSMTDASRFPFSFPLSLYTPYITPKP